ncbi:MAG: hypothetical protein MUF60_09805 [Vicinamibacterales bacterium]|jgi:hypothetical protein|nr:hypothetical protein [Vicinamibacterales bacterium]
MPVTSVKLDSAPARHRRADGELQPIPSPATPTREAEAEMQIVDGAPTPRPEVTIALQQRHHDWLLQAAAREGRSPEHFVEGLVRQACAADPHRIRNTLPQMPGQPAGTARR